MPTEGYTKRFGIREYHIPPEKKELIEFGEPIDCSRFPLGQKVMDKILKRKKV